jgi:hypothetical protein
MSTPFVHVTAAWTVDQVIGCYPAAARILDGLGVDTRVRSQCTVREAAARAHADLRIVLSRLEDTACAGDDVSMY